MSKLDQDRFLKELSIRYCLARGMFPCAEVDVASASDLSNSVELLTDLDVLGLEFTSDGGFRRTIFDCKSGKMSAINRAFWASGVVAYAHCDDAIVLLKTRAVNNHRLSAFQLGVDLHDETSFRDLGRSFDQAFDQDLYYQSSIDRWYAMYDAYKNHQWSVSLYALGRNTAPLSLQPWSVFRRMIAELRGARGHVDPSKDKHIAIFFDVLSALFILWSTMGKDIRRFYRPTMSKEDFEEIFRYYIWGGKDSYNIRRELAYKDENARQKSFEMPAWDKLVNLSTIIVAAPQQLFGCATICQALAIRLTCGISSTHDITLKHSISNNNRSRQFILSMSEYLIAACGLPRDLGTRVESVVAEL